MLSRQLNLVRGARVSNLTQNARFFSSSQVNRKEYEVAVSDTKVHKLDSKPAMTSKISGEQLLDIFTKMSTIRKFETTIGDLYKSKFVRGFCHLYSGQEAVAAGIYSIAGPNDTFITSYRCHGWMHLLGAEPENIIAELLGRSTGVSKGKGGSMHMYWKNFYGGNGIVGAQVPLGAGCAFAHKYKKDGGVNWAGYGDGAANQGQIFETYNMAKLWNLPVVFLCENNRYGMGTSQERSSASFQYYTRGDYIPGVQCDGMDMLSVREAARFCREYAASGKGPIVLETVTYRYGGHSMSDPGTSYRTRDEIKQMKSNSDPINGVKDIIIENGIATKEQLDAITKKIKKDVDAAAERAKAAPEIPVEAMYDDVYLKPLEPARGPDAFYHHKYN